MNGTREEMVADLAGIVSLKFVLIMKTSELCYKRSLRIQGCIPNVTVRTTTWATFLDKADIGRGARDIILRRDLSRISC